MVLTKYVYSVSYTNTRRYEYFLYVNEEGHARAKKKKFYTYIQCMYVKPFIEG